MFSLYTFFLLFRLFAVCKSLKRTFSYSMPLSSITISFIFFYNFRITCILVANCVFTAKQKKKEEEKDMTKLRETFLLSLRNAIVLTGNGVSVAVGKALNNRSLNKIPLKKKKILRFYFLC